MYSWMLEHLGFPLLSSVSRSQYWDLYREMLQADRLPLAELQALQWQRFKALLEHAYARVPYHREAMNELAVSPSDIQSAEDLHRLPIMTKGDIQRNFPDRVAAEDSDTDDWQYVSTRGTADRLMVIHDFAKRDTVRAGTTRSLFLSGGYRVGKKAIDIPPDICSIVCGAEGEGLDGVVPHLWHMTRQGLWKDPRAISSLRGRIERNWIFRKRTLQPFGSRGTSLPEEDLDAYARAIRRNRPYLLKALPTYLLEIARYVEAKGEPPLPARVVKPMGGSVSPAMREVIERNVEGEYREEYGSAEFGDMACDCSVRDGLHVFSDRFLIETVRHGRAAGEGELGKILITDLSNRAMPMIRYQIGDVGRLVSASHGCGREAPRLYVDGRIEDTLVTDAGRVFTNDTIVDYFRERGDVTNFQVIQKHDGLLELQVVPSATQNGVGPSLVEDFRAFLGTESRVSLYEVTTIKPEASGKFRFVHSRSYSRLDEV